MSVPKVIHCVWVGGKKFPRLPRKCIKSWKKHLPDYQIKIWNEKNFPIDSNRFCAEAYQAKQYAFVSDYIRMYVLYHEGGIYMDTDVEVLRPFTEEMIGGDGFAGFETDYRLCTAVLGCAPGQAVFGQMLDSYASIRFINEDGTKNNIPNVLKFTAIATEHGLKPNDSKQTIAGLTIYPQTFFSPLSLVSDEPCISENTHTIHHFSGTWCNLELRFHSKWNHGIKKRVTSVVGKRLADLIYRIVYNLCRLLDHLER